MMIVSDTLPIRMPGSTRRGNGLQTFARRTHSRRAFSLIELMIVLMVVVILTTLLLPALGHVREHARRVVCASNLHNVGVAMQSYFDDWNSYPFSIYGDPEQYSTTFEPQEMMASKRADSGHYGDQGWDGLGLLFAGQYCSAPNCFYCPSHRGDHLFEEYEDQYYWPSDTPIYSNYQYAGHLEWTSIVNGNGHESYVVRRRTPGLRNGHEAVLVADGLRTAADFNHKVGTNILRADISVKWFEDASGEIISRLEEIDVSTPGTSAPLYAEIWGELEDPASTSDPSGTHGQQFSGGWHH
jgi:prepilin-type N-terminal cleavage/methylation domain-containing protein